MIQIKVFQILKTVVMKQPRNGHYFTVRERKRTVPFPRLMNISIISFLDIIAELFS